MPSYQWSGKKSNVTVSGTLTAANLDEAFSLLQAQGVEIEEVKEGGTPEEQVVSPERPKVTPQAAEEKENSDSETINSRVTVVCTHCYGQLRLPSGRSGSVTCPHCDKTFSVNTRDKEPNEASNSTQPKTADGNWFKSLLVRFLGMVMPISYVVCTLGIVHYFDPLLISYVIPISTEIEYDNGIYEGKVSNREPHGIGTWQVTSGEGEGEKYVGEWKDGKKHGQGTFTYGAGPFEGDQYIGEIRDGKRHGQGTYTFSDGVKYVGAYKDGKYDGQGTYIFSDGARRVGEFKDRKLWEGTEYDKDGNVIATYSEGVRKSVN